jgi:hypothetical protein
MSYISLLVVLVIGFFLPLSGQNIILYGMQQDSLIDPNDPFGFSPLRMVQMNPFSGDTDSLFVIDNSALVAGGSSTYNDQDREYIYWGIDGNGVERIYNLDLEFGTTLSSAVTTGRPIELEYDFQFGNTYGLQSDPNNNHEPDLVEVDLSSGTSTVIDPLDGVAGVVLNTSTFDSNEGFYVFMGVDQNFDFRLYTVDVINGFVLSNPIVDVEEGSLMGFLEYDVVGQKLYGLVSQIDSSDYNQVWDDYRREVWLAEIDQTSGFVSTVGEDPLLDGFLLGVVVGGVVFDQESQTLVVSSEDVINGGLLSLVDVETATVFNQTPLTETIYELQCDNLGFIEGFYAPNSTTSVPPSIDMTIAPNPSEGYFQLSLPPGLSLPIPIQVVNGQGQVIFREELSDYQTEINLSGLPAGTYYLQLPGKGVEPFIIR